MQHRKREPQVLSKSEQLSLLKQPNPRAPTGLRNLCLISLMLKTGLKAAEALSLREQDIDWEKGQLFIQASGGAEERYLAIDDVELSLLKSWRRIKPGSGTVFFTTLKGEPLKDRYLREMIKRYARKAGIGKDVYPHLLRLTFALDFLHEARNIEALQQVLGHRDQSTTHQYTSQYFIEYSGLKDKPGSDQEVFADLIRQRETKKNKADQKNALELDNPYIAIEAEEGQQERRSIPAMKCCRCNFILHYQGDCPQCGTSFQEIIKHWGKSL
jgi:integrase/recombinase XerD